MAAETADQQLNKVEITGEAGLKQMREVAAGKVVLGRGLLEQSKAQSIEDVLRRDPAVTVSASGKIGLQGLPGYTAILLDGERPPAGIRPLELPPAQVERIEIIRGSTAETGMMAIAGTINVIRRKQRSTLPLEWSGSVSVPRAALRTRFSVQASWRDDAAGSVVGFTLNADRLRTRQPASEEGWLKTDPTLPVWRSITPSEASNDRLSLEPSMSLRLNASDSLKLSGHLSRSQFATEQNAMRVQGGGAETALPLRGASRWKFSASPTVFGSGDWERKLASGGRWVTRASYEADMERNDTTGFAQFQSDDAAPITNIANSDERQRRVAQLRIQRQGIVLGDHKLQWGLQWKHESLRHERGTRSDDEQNSFIDSLFSARATDVNSDLGSWVEDDWQWSDALALNLGLRYERLVHRLDDPTNPSQAKLAILAPSLNAAWTLDEDERHMLSVEISRGFQVPHAIRLNPRPVLDPMSLCSSRARCGANRPDSPDKAGNPALRPETSWGFGVHLDSNLADHSSVSLGMASRWISGVVIDATQLESVRWSDGARWVARPINGGHARSWSMDLGFNLALTDWVKEAPLALEMTGSLQWANSHLNSVPGPDNRLPDQSPFAARLGIKHKMTTWPIEWRSDWSVHPTNWWRSIGGLERRENTRRSWSVSGTWNPADSKNSFSLELRQLVPNIEVRRSTWVASPYGRTDVQRPATALVVGWTSKL